MKREAFNFYRSYYDVLEDIHRDEDKLTYLLALLDRQFKGIEPTLEGIPKLVYNGQRHSIDKQVEGWENKTKCKLSPTEGGSVPPYLPPSEGSTEHPYITPFTSPSDAIDMTTEPPSVPPSVQEQEKGKEKEKEEVKEQLSKNDFFKMISELIKLGLGQEEAESLILEEYEVIE